MEEFDKLNEDTNIQKQIANSVGKLEQDVTVNVLLESLAEGVVIVNEEGVIIFVNHRLSEMIGYSKQEVIGKNLNVMIPELLIFASMKKEDVKLGILDMNSIIDSTIQRLKFQVNQLSAKIHVHENLSNCVGYAAWIEEVYFNFISNALKYGGNPPIIEIYCEKLNDGYVKYSVKDNGNGIDPEHKAIIFDDINQKKEKLTKGLGLGLTIVKSIIEKFNGRVSVESEIGKGSIFSFYLKEY